MKNNSVGFTQIPNDIYRAIMSMQLSEVELVVFLAILRHTYGYSSWRNKKVPIPLSSRRIASLINYSHTYIYIIIDALKEKNMIILIPGERGKANKLMVNDKVSMWECAERGKKLSKKKEAPKTNLETNEDVYNELNDWEDCIRYCTPVSNSEECLESNEFTSVETLIENTHKRKEFINKKNSNINKVPECDDAAVFKDSGDITFIEPHPLTPKERFKYYIESKKNSFIEVPKDIIGTPYDVTVESSVTRIPLSILYSANAEFNLSIIDPVLTRNTSSINLRKWAWQKALDNMTKEEKFQFQRLNEF